MAEHQIQEYTIGVSQNLAYQSVLKMPKVMHADPVDAEAFGQMGADRFNKLSDAPAKLAQRFRQVGMHVFPNRSDNQDPVAVQQKCLPVRINESFVSRCDPFKAFQQRVQGLNIVRPSSQQRIMGDHTKPRDALAWPIINPSLHILLIPPYWLDAPLWFHRFWQMAMRVGMLGFTSWALITRLALPKRALRFFVWLWAFLFLFPKGPLYFPLALSGILVLLGFSAQRPLRTWIAILIASAWCGLSRINWFPVPASLAALLYLLETPYERGSFWRYIVAPILWVIAGTSTALIAQRVYISVSGTESSAFYTSLVSDLLWYRLLPNAT